MSLNPLNDISKIYLEQIAESAVPGKPAERLGAVAAIPKSEQDAARERILAKAKAKREAMKTEALDPVGQEDADIDNDGDTDKSDKYLHNRRKAIGKAIKKKSVKEGFSNWRQDLAEVMDDEIDEKEIKEKKVNNKIKINPEFKESVEEGDGVVLLEMVEIDEFDFVVEGVYLELLDEGYEEEEIEDAIEYALTEAKVTFGHDTPVEKKRSGLMAAAKKKLAGVKKAAKQAVATGARKVAKGALGVARKMEGGDSKPSSAHTKTRSASTYRGAGAGTKERVSSGSYTPPAKKKAEKPADPWEGSATTPTKAKTKKAAAPKAKAPAKKKKSSKLDDLLASVRSESVIADRAKNAVADDRLSAEQEKTNSSMNRLRAQSKRHEKSTALARTQARIAAKKSEDTARAMHPKPGVSGRRIEDPKPTGSKPSGYRIEEVDQIDEKITAKTDMGAAIKDFYASKSPQLAGRTKEERRKAAIAAVLTARRGGRKLGEQMDTEPAEPAVDKKKEMMDKQKLANMKMLQQKQQMLQRQKLQMQKSGKLPLEAD